MKIFKYKSETDPTKEAHQLCKELETLLGVKLMLDDPENPNDVHGYFETSDDGTCLVYLYEDEDIQIINSAPAHLKSKAFKKRNFIKKSDFVGLQIVEKCDRFFENKGFKILKT